MLEKIKSFLFENKNARQTVAKNSFWLTVSNLGGRLIKAAIIIYAARILGTSEYGVFSYAITLAGFFGIFGDPGINSVLMRDGGQGSQEDQDRVFSATLVIKTVLIVICMAIIVFIGPFFSTLPGAKALLPIAATILAFDSVREFLISLMRSREKMQWDAGIFLFTNLAIVIFGFAFMLQNPTAIALSWGYAVGLICGAVFAIIVTRKEIVRAFSNFSARFALPIIQAAWPFAVTGAIGMLFTNTDILIISWMKTAADVGIYSAAIRIIQVLYIVPGIIQMSTLPLFSRLAKRNAAGDREKFREALERTVSFIFLASLPLAIGGIILATPIMRFIFGDAFTTGGAAFKLLLATLVIDYPGSVIINAIFAYSQQRSLIVASALGAITNVGLDILLIPHWGMTGSAMGTLIAQIITNGYLWYRMKRVNYFEIMPYLPRMFGAAIIMGLATAAMLFGGVNLIVNIVISGVVYLVCLRIFREPALRELLNVVKPNVV